LAITAPTIPVLDLETGRVMITSQNHGFAVDEASLPANLRPTHRSCLIIHFRGSKELIVLPSVFRAIPEASPGPHDIRPLFARFQQPDAPACAAGCSNRCRQVSNG
jgi:carbamoyl-phosphate synthase small subunit